MELVIASQAIGFTIVIVGAFLLTWVSMKATSIGWRHIIGGFLMLAGAFVVGLPLMRFAVEAGVAPREIVSLLLAAAAFILIMAGFPMSTQPLLFFTERETSTVKKVGQICLTFGTVILIVAAVIGLWR